MKRVLLALVLLCSACLAQITAGGADGKQGTGTSLATTTGLTSSQNDLCVVACSAFGVTINAPTDSKTGNTWTQCTGSPQASAGTSRIAVWWAQLSGASSFGASHTFTCHPASTSDQGIAVQCFHGVTTSTPTDSGAGTNGSSTTPSSGNVTPTVSGDVLVGAQTHDGSPTTTKGANFTSSFIGDATSSAQPVGLEYHIKTDALAEAANWSLSVSNGWAAAACAFKPAAGAAAANGVNKKQKLDQLEGIVR